MLAFIDQSGAPDSAEIPSRAHTKRKETIKPTTRRTIEPPCERCDQSCTPISGSASSQSAVGKAEGRAKSTFVVQRCCLQGSRAYTTRSLLTPCTSVVATLPTRPPPAAITACKASSTSSTAKAMCANPHWWAAGKSDSISSS